MKTLILIADAASGVSPLEPLATLGPTHWPDPKRQMATLGEEWVSVGPAEDAADDYDAQELARLRAALTRPTFFTVEGNSVSLIARYVAALPAGEGLYLDNDHGWIAPVDDYKRAIAQGADWLYAHGGPVAA